MLNKNILKTVCIILSLMLFACLFCGCDEGDIYGAASDYIKVSHNDTDKAEKLVEVGTVSGNEESGTDVSDDVSSADNTSSDEISSNNSIENTSSVGNSSADVPKLEGDQSPVIVFNN